MFLIAGMLAALFERSRSGKGQVVDAAMVDGASMLAAPFFAFMAAGLWQDRRGSNLLDCGAPFYDTYETADGRHVAVACLEPQFFAEFARLLPLDAGLRRPAVRPRQLGRHARARSPRACGETTRDEWTALFAGGRCLRRAGAVASPRRARTRTTARGKRMSTPGGFERPRRRRVFRAPPRRSPRRRDGDALDAAAILAAFRHFARTKREALAAVGRDRAIADNDSQHSRAALEEDKKNVIRETDAEAIRLAKTLIRTARYGALAVLDPQTGAPLASRVGGRDRSRRHAADPGLVAVGAYRRPSSPTRAARCCSASPARATRWRIRASRLRCRAARLERGTPEQARAERRYLNRNPKAKLYAGLGDFSFFRLEVERASLNGGFGKAYLLDARRSHARRPGDRRARRGRAAGDRPHERRPSRRDRRLCAAFRQGGRRRLVDHRHRRRRHRHRLRRRRARGSSSPSRLPMRGELRKMLVELAKAGESGQIEQQRTEIR